jgi:CRISPR-associated protein Cas2
LPKLRDASDLPIIGQQPATPMSQRSLYLAAYDVCHPRRLAAALKLVRAHASGGQKSAHEIHLTDAERQHLLGDMRALLNDDEDSFMLIRLDPRAKVETLGRAVPPSDAACMYFG